MTITGVFDVSQNTQRYPENSDNEAYGKPYNNWGVLYNVLVFSLSHYS